MGVRGFGKTLAGDKIACPTSVQLHHYLGSAGDLVRLRSAPLGFALLMAAAALAQSPAQLPEGPGKDLVEAVCTACHTLERVAAKHATKAEWQDKVLEMLQEDPDITQQERDRIVEYLASTFRPLPKINVNKASAKELEAALELAAKDAEAIVAYRADRGNFKNLEDLKKVPGLDAVKLAARADRLEF